LKEGINLFIYLENLFYEEFERYVKTGSSLHRGAIGETGGGSFTGTFERKIKCVSEFLFLEPEDIKSYVWGPSGTSARNRAPMS
jgi:hypothetical protein